MTPRSKTESGFAVLVVLFLVTFVVGLVVSSAQMFAARKTHQDTTMNHGGYALQFAQAGITEATNWFRRQSSQPVLEFAPILDVNSDPKILDTMEPEIGLVREFAVTGNLWGRYEVWKPTNLGDSAEQADLRQALGVKDISRAAGEDSDGVIWTLRCRGVVYRRMDSSKAPNESPNSIVAMETVEAEIRRTLSINLPGKAALSVARGDAATLGSRIRIRGGEAGTGVVFPAGTGTPNSSADITGVQAMASIPSDRTELRSVVGVTLEELKQVADYIVTDVSELPDHVTENSVVVLENPGVIAISPTNALRGRFMLVCTGSIAVSAGSMTNFSGLMFIEGALTIQDGPCWIRGATIVRGTVDLQGTNDFSTIALDSTVLDEMRKLFSYRVSGPIHKIVAR